MRTNDTPGSDHLPSFLSGTENEPIVFGADGLRFSVKSVGIGRNQREQICHDKPIVSPCGGKGSNASKRWIKLRFVCDAGVEADPGAPPGRKKRLPRVHEAISISSIKAENAVVLHGVCFTFGRPQVEDLPAAIIAVL
jgi:hypothetical protein